MCSASWKSSSTRGSTSAGTAPKRRGFPVSAPMSDADSTPRACGNGGRFVDIVHRPCPRIAARNRGDAGVSSRARGGYIELTPVRSKEFVDVRFTQSETVAGGPAGRVIGKAKSALGSLLGNDELEREGNLQEAHADA